MRTNNFNPISRTAARTLPINCAAKKERIPVDTPVVFINDKHKYLSKHTATVMPAVTAYTVFWKRATSRAQFSPLIFVQHLPSIARHSVFVTLLFSVLFIRASVFLVPSRFCRPCFFPPLSAFLCQDTEQNRNKPWYGVRQKIPRNFSNRLSEAGTHPPSRHRTHRGEIDSSRTIGSTTRAKHGPEKKKR